MTIRKRQSTANKAPAKQPPGLIAWYVTKRGEKSFWTRIGAAWDHEDGKGISLQLDLMPIGEGRIVLREPSTETEDQEAGA